MNLEEIKVRRENKWYGWRPDLPDHRDYLYKPTTHAAFSRDTRKDLRPSMPHIRNQGDLGSCTGHGARTAMVAALMRENKFTVDLSPLFIYFVGRMIEGTINSDAGCEIRDVIKAIVKYGACSEQEWPYDISKFADKPGSAEFTDALKDKVYSYMRVNQNLAQMRQCINSGYGFVFGISVYESFESDDVSKSGIVPMPDKKEKLLGGHCVFACGYDDKLLVGKTRGALICANSWDTDWGDKGYFYLPYLYATNRQLASDFWTIQKVAK